MSLLIKDQEAVFTPLNVPTGLGNTPSVTARPNVSPFSVLVSGSYVQDLSRLRVASMDPNRNWYLNLPWPSESLPSGVQWTILRSDGTALSGTVPEGVAGPVTVAQLLATYGWSYTTLPAPGNTSALSLTLTAPQEFTVTGSPSGPTGTIGLAWANEAGNTFFAAPSGSTGVPGFRALVAADIPNIDAAAITSGTLSLARLSGITASQMSASAGILGSQLSATAGIVHGQVASVDASALLGTVPSANLPIATAGALGAIKVGTGLSIASGVLSTVNNGTVTSVAMTVPADFGISGSAITGSGTLGLTWNSQTGNVVMASPSGGGAGTPTFRSLVSGDIPSLDANKITTGTLALAQGGTNADSTSITGNKVFASPDGTTGSVSYRSLVAADIPNLSATKITTGQLALARGGTAVDGSSITANFVFSGPTSGIASSAGFRALVAGDIPAVNPSALTGSGTVPLGALSGITTTQLSATAGIVAAQISTIPTHASKHAAGGTDESFGSSYGHNSATRVETMPRFTAIGTSAVTSQQIWWAFFTPDVSLTVSNITFITSGTQTAVGTTFCRFGLYTADTVGNMTLVAATANDTTLLAAQNAVYTRPITLGGDLTTALSTYNLVRGTRYAVAMIWVGTGTAPTLKNASLLSALTGLTPMMACARSTQSDLSLTTTSAQIVSVFAFMYAYLT